MLKVVPGFSFQASRHNTFAAPEFAAVAYHATVLLADLQSATGNLRGAVDDYNTALAWAPELLDHGIRPEVVHNNLSMAYLGLGDTERAKASVDRALAADAMNPVFLMSAGFIAERAQNVEQAIDDNRRLCTFLYRNLATITRVIPTMDTHHAMQIFHPIYLVDERGGHPAPFTLVSAEDVERGVWRFNASRDHARLAATASSSAHARGLCKSLRRSCANSMASAAATAAMPYTPTLRASAASGPSTWA